ncbi:hypothetical protein L218DRAFT_944979 [Marasmius fiardii PR-910]|nr:hypothetical protein L218DRAFT_944979 [Marasmius fiardii PR-910]
MLGLSKLKGEPDEWKRKISTTLDSQDSSLKNMDRFMVESTKTMSALLKELQEQRDYHQRQESGAYSRLPPQQRLDARPMLTYNNNGESSSPCILCHKSRHFQKDCPEGKELMETGWICLQLGTNRVVMRDDSKIPWATFGSGPMRVDLVRKIAEEKGWPGSKAVPQGFYFDIEEELPVAQSYMISGIENGNEDDEIASIWERMEVLQMELRSKVGNSTGEQSKN